MTLDHFIRFNATALGERGAVLAQCAGFGSLAELADGVADLKRLLGLPSRLGEIGIRETDLDALVEDSFHPLMNNNPRGVSPAELRALYEAIL